MSSRASAPRRPPPPPPHGRPSATNPPGLSASTDCLWLLPVRVLLLLTGDVARVSRSKDHDLVCGECKVLVDNFEETYGGHCTNYCAAVGMNCVGAWEEVGDTCEEASAESCDHHMHGEDGSSITTSDAICQCEPAGGQGDGGGGH